MEKKAISVDQVKENFSINGEQAESVIRQLETIGVLGSKNEDGTHTVMMDKDAFINRVRGYQDLAERMRAVAASKNANLYNVKVTDTDRKKSYRKSTIHQSEPKNKGLSRFKQKDAKACYKMNRLVLVNLDILDEYLETFHIEDEEFYK